MQEADRIRLVSDMILTQPKTINHDLELDLNGHEILSETNAQYLFNVNGGKLILKGNGGITTNKRLVNVASGELVIENGTYTSINDVAFSASGVNSKVTMNGGRIAAVEGGIGAFDKAEVEVNGGEIEISDNFCLFTNGTAGRGGNKITLNGGKLTGHITSAGYEAVGIYIANKDTFVMNGGEIYASNGTGICQRGGDVTINNGKIIVSGEPGHDGKIGDCPVVMEGISAIVYHKHPSYQNEGMKLTVNGGTITGVDHSIDVVSDEETPNVHVTGGNLNPMWPEE